MGRSRSRHDLFRRGHPPATTERFRPVLVAFMFLAASLLVLSRMENDTVKHVRWQLLELMTPVLAQISGPLENVRNAGRKLSGVFDQARELEHLQDENRRLKGWEWRAMEAERKLADLSALTSVVKEQAMAFVTSRVIANSSGPFVRSALINVGEQQGVKTGYPVMSGDGLVGRVVETGKAAAQVLLVTDYNSRIPVHVGRRGVRGIVVGDNGPMPRLSYVPSDGSISEGDEVSSSGVGGLFPRGLRIGIVVKDNGMLRIRPNASLDSLEYLSVIFYDTPTLGLIESTKATRGAALEKMQQLPPSAPRAGKEESQ